MSISSRKKRDRNETGSLGNYFVLFCIVSTEQKNFDEESITSLSTSVRDETRDGFCPEDLTETSALQALQERTYGFSFWPKVSLNNQPPV